MCWFRLPPIACLPFIAACIFDAGIAAAQPVPPPVPVVGRQPRPAAAANESVVSDEEALKSAGLSPTDGRQLVEYLKLRTLSDADQGKITAIIKRFGADSFEERLKASEEIERYGPAAVGPLKTAERDSDAEVAYRARAALKKLSKIPHAAVASAAVRALVKLKPDGAATALLGFLPLSDEESVAVLIRQALVDLALKDGRPDPALLAYLTDPSPVRRAAVYFALTQGGLPEKWASVKAVYPELRAAIVKDADPEARFIGLWSLLMASRDKGLIAELIDMIPKISRGRLWQLEDLLLQLAGTHPKDGRFLKSPEALAKARDAWAAWWTEKGAVVDFAKLDFKPRVLGVLDLLMADTSGLGQSRVVSLGPDLKEALRIPLTANPSDLMHLGPDRLLVAESTQGVITERSTSGTVLNRLPIVQPLNLLKGAEGNIIVVSRNQVAEFDKDKEWKAKATYQRPNNIYDVMAGVRLPGGDVVIVTGAFPAQGRPNCFRLDSKLKETNKTFTLGRVQVQQWMDSTGPDTILVCENDKVAEYDLTTGKQTWKFPCAIPTSCQRLFNGNTLIAMVNADQVIEVDPSGEVVWEYDHKKDGPRISRARMR